MCGRGGGAIPRFGVAQGSVFASKNVLNAYRKYAFGVSETRYRASVALAAFEWVVVSRFRCLLCSEMMMLQRYHTASNDGVVPER
ncbi:hypothetical protein JOE09_000651 [Pantoea coffeiphila]|nr:hypothetical protein [Pantoea coffeiphila]